MRSVSENKSLAAVSNNSRGESDPATVSGKQTARFYKYTISLARTANERNTHHMEANELYADFVDNVCVAVFCVIHWQQRSATSLDRETH